MGRTLVTALSLLLTVFVLPVHTFAAEELIKLKHGLSLYDDGGGNALNRPEGVACSEDRLVVADTGNGRMVLYTMQAGNPGGGAEIKIPQIQYPKRVALSPKGDIFVVDERQRKLVRLSPEGAFKQYVELGGGPTESMIVPGGVVVDARETIYLLDIHGGRVVILDAEGKDRKQIEFPKEHGFITDLAVNAKGQVFLLDSVDAVVYSNVKDPLVFAPLTAKLKDDLKFGSNMTIDDKGMLFISDQNSGGIVVVGVDGSIKTRLFNLGWKEGTVRYPSQICVDKSGGLFVADRANSRIQKFVPLQ
jgi:sugar lactone lactonase YvrE